MLGHEQPQLLGLAANGFRGDLGGDVGGHRDDPDDSTAVVAHRSMQCQVALPAEERASRRLLSLQGPPHRQKRRTMLGELGHAPAEKILGLSPGLLEAARDIGESKVGVERREGHRQGGDGRIDERLAAALSFLRGALLAPVLKKNDELDGPAIVVANHRHSRQRGKDGAVPTLQEPLHRVALALSVGGKAFDHVVGRALVERKDQTDVGADELVDAEARHGAEGLVDDIDAERRKVDDELAERAALEHSLVEPPAFLEGGCVGCQPGGGDPGPHIARGPANHGVLHRRGDSGHLIVGWAKLGSVLHGTDAEVRLL